MEDQIFEGKSFQDLTQDIYKNASKKRKQIDLLITELNKMIKSIDDVVLLAPIIKEYLEKLKPKLNFYHEKNLFLFDPLKILMQLQY